MFLSIIGAVAGGVAIPVAAVGAPTAAVATSTSVVGLSQGMNNQQAAPGDAGPDPKDDPRLAKFTLRAYCSMESSAKNQVHDKQVVLRNGKVRGRLYIHVAVFLTPACVPLALP